MPRTTKLIVLDEVSMVGEEMARDLMSFGKPILVLGDPGQLPPIKGEGAFTSDAPDVMLTEIHRQADESAIIRLATMARQGEPIGFGQYDAFVCEDAQDGRDAGAGAARRPGHLRPNATRLQLNNAMRRAAGFGDGGILPSGPMEKIICLKNQNDLGLINGMFVTLDDIVDEGSLYFSARSPTRTGSPIGPLLDADGTRGRLRIYKGHFEDHVAFDPHRHDRDWKDQAATLPRRPSAGRSPATSRKARNGRTSSSGTTASGRARPTGAAGSTPPSPAPSAGS